MMTIDQGNSEVEGSLGYLIVITESRDKLESRTKFY